MRILYFGSCEYSLRVYQQIQAKRNSFTKFNIDVATPKYSKKQERYEIAKLHHYAFGNNLPFSLITTPTLKGWIPENTYDLALVVSFGYFIPRRVLDYFPRGAINLHPSLLPKGASPIEYAIKDMVPKTGVSVINIHDQKMDAGSILHQMEYEMKGDETYNVLREDLADLGAHCLVETLNDYDNFQVSHESIFVSKKNAAEQDEEKVTMAPKIKRDLCKVSPVTMTANEIYAIHRAIRNR
ncbi:Formyltransferase, partial [Rozella allomycis CSF55]